MLTPTDARAILKHADLLFSAAEVTSATRQVAAAINRDYADQYPLVLSVMGGAVVFTGQLLPMLDFPLDFDIVQASRYGTARVGKELTWRVAPRDNIAGRHVLILDDILDEGITLAAVVDLIKRHGAASVKCAVFCDKALAKPKPLVADYIGITVPDRFVFGYGMDISGAWRNLPAIYAVKGK